MVQFLPNVPLKLRGRQLVFVVVLPPIQEMEFKHLGAGFNYSIIDPTSRLALMFSRDSRRTGAGVDAHEYLGGGYKDYYPLNRFQALALSADTPGCGSDRW